MKSPIISTTGQKHSQARRKPGKAGARLSQWSILAVGIVCAAWVAVLILSFRIGFEWTRLSGLLGILLPVCALAPFAVSWRKNGTGKPRASGPKFVGTSLVSDRQVQNAALLDSIPAALPLWRLFERIARTGRTDYPVVDESGHIVGEIERADMPPLAARDALGWLIAADIMRDTKRIDR